MQIWKVFDSNQSRKIPKGKCAKSCARGCVRGDKEALYLNNPSIYRRLLSLSIFELNSSGRPTHFTHTHTYVP